MSVSSIICLTDEAYLSELWQFDGALVHVEQQTAVVGPRDRLHNVGVLVRFGETPIDRHLAFDQG
jgi:hypothetical protein